MMMATVDHVEEGEENDATLSLDEEELHSLSDIKQNYDLRLSGRHNITGVEEELDDFLNRTTQLVFQYQQGRKVPKLREPRNLYALTKEAGPQQATRWPSHVQCIRPAVRFIDYSPPEPEPLVKATGKETTPSIRGGELIYCNDPGSDPFFTRSRVAGCRLTHDDVILEPLTTPADDLTLEFESRFESGNLFKVEKISNFEYELTLRPDLYTNKHTQWFFFRVRNMRKKKNYRFTITNLMKPSSLYNNGMQPVFYSSHDAKTNKIGWRRKGENIRYYKNNYMENGRCHYSLTWTCEFAYDDDVCYFAHCYPYTYTDLQDYLLDLANDPVRSRFCKQRVLCRTLAGNLVYILTITSPSRNPEVSRTKRAVVLTARVHPGETNASWMMKGFLDYLTGSTADAKLLRDTFIFKIVPMLNPDGVIVGNYRCSLTGRDLNRNYKSSLKDSFPSIWHTKLMIKRLHAEREVVLYCDLHGHSRKHNIFIYGCENKHKPEKKLRERVFPLMLSKNSRHSFSFRSCKYKVQKSKEGTGRIVVWCMGIMNSYTMEATFGGTTMNGKYKDTHLNPRDLEAIGYDFCDTILDYCDPDKCKMDACMKELTERMKTRMECRARGEAVDSMSDSDTSGSDSSVDDGLPVNLLSNMPKINRKKKLRSRSERNKLTASPTKQTMTPPAATKVVLPKSVDFRAKNRENTKKEEKPVRNSPDERNERSAKKDEYLQALTSAYIRSGLLVVSEPRTQTTTTTTTAAVKEFSFNYTQKGGGDEEGNTDTGLTTQYLTDRVNQLTANEQYENLRQSALKKQLSAGQQRILAQKHLAAVASMQQNTSDQHQQNIQQHTAQALRRFAAMATTTSGATNHNIFLRQPQQTTTYEEVKETEAEIHPRTEDRGMVAPQGSTKVVVPNSNKMLKTRGTAILPEKGTPSSESGDSSVPSHLRNLSDRSKRNFNVAKTKQSSGRSNDPTPSVTIETPDPPTNSQHRITSRSTASHLQSVMELKDEVVATPSGDHHHGEDPLLLEDHQIDTKTTVEDVGGGSGSRGAGFQLRLASERPMKWSKLKQGNIRSRKNRTNKPTITTSSRKTNELKKKSKQNSLTDDDVMIGDGRLTMVTNDKNANNMSPSSSKLMTSSECGKAKDASKTATESSKQKSSLSEGSFMRELPPSNADVIEKWNSACGYVTNTKMEGSKTCEIEGNEEMKTGDVATDGTTYQPKTSKEKSDNFDVKPLALINKSTFLPRHNSEKSLHTLAHDSTTGFFHQRRKSTPILLQSLNEMDFEESFLPSAQALASRPVPASLRLLSAKNIIKGRKTKNISSIEK